MINASHYFPVPLFPVLMQSDSVKMTSWGSFIDSFWADVKLQPFSFLHCPWYSLEAEQAAPGACLGLKWGYGWSRTDLAQGQEGNREGESKGHLNVLSLSFSLSLFIFFFCIYLQAMSKKSPYVFLPSELTREMVWHKPSNVTRGRWETGYREGCTRSYQISPSPGGRSDGQNGPFLLHFPSRWWAAVQGMALVCVLMGKIANKLGLLPQCEAGTNQGDLRAEACGNTMETRAGAGPLILPVLQTLHEKSMQQNMPIVPTGSKLWRNQPSCTIPVFFLFPI